MSRIFLFIVVSAMVLVTGCTNKGQTAGGADSDSLAVDSLDSPVAEVRDTTPKPMFLYYFDPDHMQVVYWTDVQEPDREWYEKNDMLQYYDQAHRKWLLFDAYRRNAAGYTQMLIDGGKSVGIRSIGEQLKNPDGEDIYPGELHSRPTIPGAGMNYALVDLKDSLRDHTYGQLHVIVHDAYMQTHKRLATKLESPFDVDKPLPKAVVKQLEEQYGMKTQRSELTYSIGDRYTYGVLQFKPKDKKVFALEVVTDGDKVYSFPVEGNYDASEANSTWNVDDGGEYFSSRIGAAFEGPDGLEFTYEHRAPESATVGMFLLRDGKLLREEYECYHQLIDESRPLWKKDIATLRKLYLDDDPHENKYYKLTKYRWIDIDDDMNEELWMRDKDDKHGALFTVKGDDIKLIGVETDKLHASFMQTRQGTGYLRISGSAGGPAVFTQIYEIRESQPVHRMTALEVYGELDECSFDGKPFDKDRAQSYLQSLPASRDPYLYWADIQE
jgi:hypothetical protein